MPGESCINYLRERISKAKEKMLSRLYDKYTLNPSYKYLVKIKDKSIDKLLGAKRTLKSLEKFVQYINCHLKTKPKILEKIVEKIDWVKYKGIDLTNKLSEYGLESVLSKKTEHIYLISKISGKPVAYVKEA